MSVSPLQLFVKKAIGNVCPWPFAPRITSYLDLGVLYQEFKLVSSNKNS
jgi:hypothetical protein